MKPVGFHVFRDVCGIHLSEDHIRDLISSGRTPILKGLTSKAGKKFNVRLVLGEDYITSFELRTRKENKEGDNPDRNNEEQI